MNREQLRQKIIRVTGAAGVDQITWAVPQGMAVRVIHGAGYHDEAGNLTCNWSVFVGATEYLWHIAVTRGQYAALGFYQGTECPEPLILRYGTSLAYKASGSAAGTVAKMELFLEEIAGDDTYGDY